MAKKVLKVAGVLAAPFTGGASLAMTAGLMGSSLLGKRGGKPTQVTGTPPIMPSPDDAAVKAARRKQVAMSLQRGGRTSTMLTSDSDTLGG